MTDTAPRPRGRPGTSADTRDRLVAAAVEVFLERGYADTRVQDITEAAGFTTGALYAHFNS
ncbi:MAG: helix-turn-helix transcriptional regulator, partial [Microthrixaceae bacterium]|nr:helix-turn-helix transcriptional regulator [Microthrixaceae bacterium]